MGRYVEPTIPEGVYAELRVAMDIKDRLNKQIGMTKNTNNKMDGHILSGV
ncbi:hypothetical protein TheetDRAFT_2754 [Thermoanaerobacter ethanolicus JW 200]|nr:hypothetical protein TheetDRAFT_2754 [Thermoanaerobacter ethanolicus JW 200]